VPQICLRLKIHDYTIIIFDEADYEAKPAVGTITYGQDKIIKYKFVSSLADFVARAELNYENPRSGDVTTGAYEVDPDSDVDIQRREKGVFHYHYDDKFLPYEPGTIEQPEPSVSGTAYPISDRWGKR
jgi:hypothetical protein